MMAVAQSLLERIPTPPDATSDDPAHILERVAAAADPLRRPDPEPPQGSDESELEEAVKKKWDWDPDKHPRWPAGTPGGLGGQFMRVGQTFAFGGKEWEIGHILDGKVVAHEASGKASTAETRIFDPSATPGPDRELTGATRPAARVIKGGKTGSDVTVVDPYVDHDSHDPSLQLPANSKLSAEDWKAFGRLEQMHYIDLMERFGEHNVSGASELIADVYHQYDSEIQNLVNSAYHSQYGASSGWTLSITSLFKGMTPGSKSLESAREKRERAKELQGRIRDAYAWDLYNRTRSPDVTLFHKDDAHNSSWWKQFIEGKKTIFSGLSMSHHFRKGFFGNTTLATPVSIRHIVMATYVAGPLKGAGKEFSGEKEMAIPHQMRVDSRSMTFDNHEIPGSYLTWLENTSTTPQGGAHLAKFKAAVEKGEPLPIPPPAPEIHLKDEGIVPPPQEALEALEEYAKKLPAIGKNVTPQVLKATGLPFEHTADDGTPEAVKAIDAGYKPGDFMMGLQGTLYWIGPNPKDPSGYGLMIHKLVGQGGKLVPNGENFVFDNQHSNYKLLGNVPPPPPEDVDFDTNAWVYSDEKAVPISKFTVGEKFKVDGQAYEVIAPGTASTTPIKNLESGLTGTINSDYQAVKLVPKEGWMPQAMKVKPKKGMSLAYEGKKHVVTSVKKDGTVSIKRSTGGKVIQLAPDDPALDGLFDHTAWKQGPMVQAGSLDIGDIFHGGRGQVIRPYRVENKDGSWVYWTNLDTGESGKSLLKKKVGSLVSADGGVGHDKAPSEATGNVTADPQPPSISEPPKLPDPVDFSEVDQAVDSLPDISEAFDAYKSAYGTGGKYKHDKISQMPTGTVFQDKKGKLFKVQATGATPIVTDGKKNWKIDGALRGRALPDKTLDGPPPPQVKTVPKDEPGAAAVGAAEPSLPSGFKPNNAGYFPGARNMTIAELPVGTEYLPLADQPDDIYKKVAPMTVMKLDNGEIHPVSNTAEIGNAVLGGAVPAAVKMPGDATPSDGETTPTLPPGFEPNNGVAFEGAPHMTIAELPVGAEYVPDLSQPDEVYTKTGPQVVEGPDGETHQVGEGFGSGIWEGGVPAMVKMPGGESAPAPEPDDDDAASIPLAAAALTPEQWKAAMVPNTDSKALDSLPVGTAWQAGSGHIYIKVGTDATGMVQGQKAGGTQSDAFLPGIAPTEYALPPAQDVTPTTVGELEPHTNFMGATGMQYQVITKKADGTVIVGPYDGSGQLFAIEPDTPTAEVQPMAFDPTPDVPSAEPLGELGPGDEFEGSDGKGYEVVSATANGSVIVLSKEHGGVAQFEPGTAASDVTIPVPTSDEQTQGVAPSTPMTPYQSILDQLELEELPVGQIATYKSSHGSGGKYKHPRLKELQPGAKVRDKTGAHFVVLTAPSGGMVLLWKPSTGDAFWVSESARVREL